jgi:hypothetical protein
MSSEIPSLKSLDFIPYLDDQGVISDSLQRKIAVYAIFDQDKKLQYVGYSRDIYLSLKQHLVRQPYNCYWLKFQTITRPSRTILDEIKQNWIQENGSIPIGNSEEESKWTEAIDATKKITEEEQEKYEKSDEINKTKILKNIARRVEAEIKETLNNRGVKMDIRFNPKLKDKGLLDLK